MAAIFLFLAVLLLIVWLIEMLSLMRMSDGQFSGRFDKPIWAAILLLGFIPGMIAFAIWQLQHRADTAARSELGEVIGSAVKAEAKQ